MLPSPRSSPRPALPDCTPLLVPFHASEPGPDLGEQQCSLLARRSRGEGRGGMMKRPVPARSQSAHTVRHFCWTL